MKATISTDSTKQPLTAKQHDVLRFLQDYTEERGFPPTMKEIGDKFSFASTNAVTQYLVALERKGYIRRSTKGASRGIQIVDFIPHQPKHITQTAPALPSPMHRSLAPMLNHQYQSVKNVVIVGDGIAQNPLSAFLSPRGQIKIDTDFFLPDGVSPDAPPPQLFAAIVGDDGMSAESMREGDIVVAKQQFSALEGDIVVALFHDTLLVRRFVRMGGVSELEAATKTFPPISFHEGSGTVAIIGVVLGQMRKFV
ncbi:MAG: transcriptional repressor LexA [Candidatus Kapaibacteriota bacterium]|jgi:repressor LexA